MPTDYGPIAALAQTILYPVTSPAASFAGSLNPATVIQATAFRHHVIIGDTWLSTAVAPAQEYERALTSFARMVPTWALDYRGLFANTNAYTATTVFTAGYPIQSNNNANTSWNTFSEVDGNIAQWPQAGISILGQLRGQVQEEGVAVAGRSVALYFRPTMQLIAQLKSDATGHFAFTGLEPGRPDYIIVGVNVLPLVYDGVIHDTLAPAYVSDIPLAVPNYTDPGTVLPSFTVPSAIPTQTVVVDFGVPAYGADTFTYAFYRNGVTLLRTGVTASRYQPFTTSAADSASTLSCQFTARNGAGTSTLTYVTGITVA